MEERSYPGKVINLDNNRAYIKILQFDQEKCRTCPMKTLCNIPSKNSVVETELTDFKLKEGDEVNVDIGIKYPLLPVSIAYGLPVIGIVLSMAATVGKYTEKTMFLIALLAFAGSVIIAKLLTMLLEHIGIIKLDIKVSKK